MAETHKSHTTGLESQTEPRKALQAGDGWLLWRTTGGQGWVWHTPGSWWPWPSAQTTLYLEQFRSLALSQPSTGHETTSWLEQLTVHMWFWCYKPVPLGNNFCFVLFFFFLNEQFYFLTFISIQICCAVLVSPAFLLVQFLEPPSLLPFLSMFETGFNQPWSNHTPYDCRPWNMQLHQDLLLKQWFVIWSLVDCLSENPYPQETLK